MSDLATKQPTTDREALAILGFTDSLDGRNLVAEGNGDLLPYDKAFDILVELVEGKAEKNYDSRGFRIKFRVLETDAPAVVKVNREYSLWFFDQHKTIPAIAIAEMVQNRIIFAATYSGYEGDPLELDAAGAPVFKAAPVLLDIHREVEPLGVMMRIKSTFLRNTRNGKPLHKLSFEAV